MLEWWFLEGGFEKNRLFWGLLRSARTATRVVWTAPTILPEVSPRLRIMQCSTLHAGVTMRPIVIDGLAFKNQVEWIATIPCSTQMTDGQIIPRLARSNLGQCSWSKACICDNLVGVCHFLLVLSEPPIFCRDLVTLGYSQPRNRLHCGLDLPVPLCDFCRGVICNRQGGGLGLVVYSWFRIHEWKLSEI